MSGHTFQESSGDLLHNIPSGHQCEWGGGRRLYYTRMGPNMRPDSLVCLNLSTGATGTRDRVILNVGVVTKCIITVISC